MTPARIPTSSALRRGLALLLTAGAALALGGCMTPGPVNPARTGPFYVPANVKAEPTLAGIRRVVVLPVWSGDAAPAETAAELDKLVIAALQEAQRFEVVSLSRETALRKFRAESFGSASALPHGFLAELQRDLAVDAVLFVDVTVYSAYRPLALGLRGKLALIEGPRTVWAFDNVYSADDAAVANAARNHFLGADQRAPVDLTHGAIQSPSRFATYAMASMFSTLPPVIFQPARGGSAPNR